MYVHVFGLRRVLFATIRTRKCVLIDNFNTYVLRHCYLWKTLPQKKFRSVRLMATTSGSSPRRGNRLSLEKSPYLLQHANNPVDWFPWGAEAFKKAKDENKLIFLSVGYSTCHWCHVMERESFENEEIGSILNKDFISIKVDREERPDVDKVYMTFVQATTGSGGWPMSVWLTPELKPIIGGTYFPPDDRYYNRPGFKSVLQIIAQQWKEKRSEMERQGIKVLDAIMKATKASDAASSSIPGLQASQKLFEMLEKSFDEEFGGFGDTPKFPQPVNFSALLQHFHHAPDSEDGVRALHMCLYTLKMMALGGIHDHISKGFHRYSTDRFWHVPHFEKMLYDQGQLAVSYVSAYQITKDKLYEDIARDIFTYVDRDLSHPGGGFYSAEDADSLPTEKSEEKKEGAFCVWEFGEVQRLLCEKVADKEDCSLADLFCMHYGVKEQGNVDPMQDPHDEMKKKNVLITTKSAEEVASEFDLSTEVVESCLEKCRKILYSARLSRPKPHLDDKMVAAWNGLMISGYARGSQAFTDKSLKERAIKAAIFLKENMFVAETSSLLRSCYTSGNEVSQVAVPIKGFLDDYAFVVRGLLDLYECCFDEEWLILAELLQDKQNQLFWDEEGGAYFYSTPEDVSIVLRLKEDQDGAEPSGNSVAAMNLLRLSAMLGRTDLHSMAVRIFKVFSERLLKVPLAIPELVCALRSYDAGSKQIVICGDRSKSDAQALLQVVQRKYLPNKVLMVTDGRSKSLLHERLDFLSSVTQVDGKATAFVCENFTCSLPVTTADELEKLLT